MAIERKHGFLASEKRSIIRRSMQLTKSRRLRAMIDEDFYVEKKLTPAIAKKSPSI